MTDVTSPGGIATLEPLARQRQQKAWNWYDRANSAYYTTVIMYGANITLSTVV